MPWTLASAVKHTKKADTPAKKDQWAKTANAVLKQSGDEGKAVRVANAAVAKTPAKAKKKPAETAKKRVGGEPPTSRLPMGKTK